MQLTLLFHNIIAQILFPQIKDFGDTSFWLSNRLEALLDQLQTLFFVSNAKNVRVHLQAITVELSKQYIISKNVYLDRGISGQSFQE